MQAALGMVVLGATRKCVYLRSAVSKMLGSPQGCTALFSLHGTNIHHCEKCKGYLKVKNTYSTFAAGVLYSLIVLYVSLALGAFFNVSLQLQRRLRRW